MYGSLLGSGHAEAGLDKNGAENRFWPTWSLRGAGCWVVKALRGKVEKQSGIVWHRLAQAFHRGDPPSLPRVPPTKKILKQLPATNQPFVSQRQEVLRNTHGRKQTLKSFPTFFQDSWSSKPSKTSGLSAPKKQLGQRRTFVLARKTTRDRLTEEKSSCVQQREDGGGIGSECIVLPIDEANKCHRARDRGRRAWLVLGNHVGWMGGRGTNLPTLLHYHHWPAAMFLVVGLVRFGQAGLGGIQEVLAKRIKDRTRNNDEARQPRWCISRWGLSWWGEICATRNDSAYLPEDSMQRPVTQYRTCSVKIWFISRLVINFQSFIGL